MYFLHGSSGIATRAFIIASGMGMGIGMFALQCAAEFEYRWNVGLQNVRLTSFQCHMIIKEVHVHP
jgi:hypothetical protein